MRNRMQHQGLTVNAIAGSHVVFFGMDLTEAKRPGFRGFAFKRFDPATGETIWLRGIKTFEATEPHPAQGEQFSSRDHPFQGFQWADYSVKPGQSYTYTVAAQYGSATSLTTKISMDLTVQTEAEAGGVHSAYFNRGSVATQEYARRFQNKKPKDAGPGAYEWLSRGLLEALLRFLNRAGAGWQIHGAVYEFQWPAVLDSLKAAKDRGVDVKILFDNIDKPKGPAAANRQAIENAGIANLCMGRANSSKIMHNKFFVLSHNNAPVAVWTGSTNLTENGIFGHSNLGHIVEDPSVAAEFLKYWKRLEEDLPVGAPYRAQNSAQTPLPALGALANGTTAVFSPRGTPSNLDALDWYAAIAAEAKSALLMTFAFGMHENFKNVYRAPDGKLRMALLEKEGNNANTIEQDREDIEAIRNLPNVVVALGNRIATNAFDRWLKELDRLNPHVHVYWIHTKYMLVDPLGSNPIVVTGSANFSKASTIDNDENMLVIKGDTRIADIYFGEYIRLYAHYAFRESVKRYLDRVAAGLATVEWKPQFLQDDDAWMDPYFDPDDKSARYARRRYFSSKPG